MSYAMSTASVGRVSSKATLEIKSLGDSEVEEEKDWKEMLEQEEEERAGGSAEAHHMSVPRSFSWVLHELHILIEGEDLDLSAGNSRNSCT
jgi:hypothetical protein